MDFLELVGVIIGDGHIEYNTKTRIYRIEITAAIEAKNDYFNTIYEFLKKNSNNTPKIRERENQKGKWLEVYVYDKKFIDKIIKTYNLIYKNKTFDAEIPPFLLHWNTSKHIIRGIFESDGSLYFSKSKLSKYPTYPRIEIKTLSKKLAKQLCSVLKRNAFKVNKRPNRSDGSTNVYLSGDAMLEKWKKEIGFSSKKNLTKYELYKKLGYYMPKISFKERLILLKGGWPNPANCGSPTASSREAVACRATFSGFKSQSSLIPFYFTPNQNLNRRQTKCTKIY